MDMIKTQEKENQFKEVTIQGYRNEYDYPFLFSINPQLSLLFSQLLGIASYSDGTSI